METESGIVQIAAIQQQASGLQQVLVAGEPLQEEPAKIPTDSTAQMLQIPMSTATSHPKIEQIPQLWTRLTECVADGISFLAELAKGAKTPSDLLRFARYASVQPHGGVCTLLAATYPSMHHVDFVNDFQSRVWMTYRLAFPAIHPTSYSSDAGWGCMLRSGQMLLANAILMHTLSRNWRIAHNESPLIFAQYAQIIAMFLDSNASPYSIHKIATAGLMLEKQIGDWFGPNTIAHVLKILATNDLCSTMAIHVANDGVIYKDEVETILLKKNSQAKQQSVLILVPLLLGLDSVNPVYFESLKRFFEIPNNIGIAGGRPKSSLYFIGTEGDNLIYLDPHYTRPAIEPKDVLSYTQTDLLSYHCDVVRLLPIESADPSCVVGFYAKNIAEFHRLCVDLEGLTSGGTPIFTISETRPDYTSEEYASDF